MKIPNPVTKIDKRGLKKEQWLRKRNEFIGASEVGTILGLNQYESELEIWNRKVGVIDTFKPEQLSWVTRAYEGDVHPGYILQLVDQELITGWKYGELGFLLDGRYPSIIPVPVNTNLQETIIRETKKFWDTVIEGRKIWDRKDLSESDRLQQLIQFEPEITGSKALESFLKERYKAVAKAGKMIGNKDILEVAIKYLKCNENMNLIEEEKTLEGNLLRKLFMDNQIDEIAFQGEKSKEYLITYRLVADKATVRVSKDLLKLI